jgi:catechol 2,3-dioxygenase-like lactoylglutathione lyase family enzyme
VTVGDVSVESLSAVTLVTHDMAASVAFYGALALPVVFGGFEASFTTLRLGPDSFLNLQLDPTWTVPGQVWGRFILWVTDVDAMYARLIRTGYEPEMAPSDAPWGERYFHVLDPAGHEVSVARRL